MKTRMRLLTTVGGIVGLGVLLVWLLPSWGQPPRPVEQPKAERFGSGQDPFSAVEKMQREIQRMQRELERARAELDRNMRDLQQRQLVGQPKEPAANRRSRQRAQTQNDFTTESAPGGYQAPSAIPGSAPMRTGGVPGDFDRRLRDVERKLDMLIRLLEQNQRSGSRSGARPSAAVPPTGTSVPAYPTPSVAPAATPVVPPQPVAPGRRSADVAPVAVRVGFQR